MSADSRTAAGNSVLAFLHSIRFRLTLWFVLILALVLAGFSLLIFLTQSRDYQVDAFERMQEDYVRIQEYFGADAWESTEPFAESLPAGEPPIRKGDLLLVVGADGSMLGDWGASTTDPSKLVDALLAPGNRYDRAGGFERSVAVTGPDGKEFSADYLFIVEPITRDGRLQGYLILGSQSDLVRQQQRLAGTLALGSLVMLALAFLGGLWLADRAMRPVAAIAVAARDISEGDLGRRLNLPGRDELAVLARTFDEMIARLQTAFERQRRFVADASHELRTPITIINLEAARGLASKSASGESQRALQTIASEGSRMARLVNDLMTLARMDSGQAILQPVTVDLGEVTLEAVERMSPLAQQRGVSLEAGEMPELRIRGDAQYLLIMISNLIENAIKYGGEGQAVRVGLTATERGAELRISDTGPGIPAEHLPAIFDRFYRVDPARSQENTAASPSGSGLGLSIVAEIVKAHHGTVQVVSEIGHGTTFVVTLPME